MTGLTQLTASGIRYLMTMKKIIDAGDVPRCIDISKEIQCKEKYAAEHKDEPERYKRAARYLKANSLTIDDRERKC